MPDAPRGILLLLAGGLVACATGGDGAIYGAPEDDAAGGVAARDDADDADGAAGEDGTASTDGTTARSEAGAGPDAPAGQDTSVPETGSAMDASVPDGRAPRDGSPDAPSDAPSEAPVEESGGPEASDRDGGVPDEAGPDAAAEASLPDAAPSDARSDVVTCPEQGFSGTLVTIDLSSQPGSETGATPTAVAAGLTAGNLVRAPAVGANPALVAVSGSGSINASNWPTSTTPDADRYYSFTVTPVSGCSLTLTALALDVRASATGPADVDLATSADGFAAHSAAFAGTSLTTVPLSVTAGVGAVELRIYGYGAGSGAGTLRIQNILTLSGALH